MNKNIQKLFDMITFFSQRFHIEQLTTYGYNYLHVNLNFINSVIYLLDEGSYKLKGKTDYGDIPLVINTHPYTEKVATHHGRLVTHSFEKYLPDLFIETTKMKLLIPLIVKNKLIGFIVSEGIKDHNMEDYVELIDKANILINNALSIALADEEYKEMSKVLDKEIFSLLFVNQSSRLLLSELDIDKLYLMCIDMVRELTASSVTSLGLYDETHDKLIIRGYKDVIDFKEKYAEFTLNKNLILPRKIIYHVKNDKDDLKLIFEDIEGFKALDAEYVVLIVKEKVIGFITISEPVNEKEYDKSTFEMIESLASSIYISIMNAKYFKSIQKYGDRMQKQLLSLERMNATIANIQACDDIKEMSELIMDALNIGFDVEKAMVISRSGQGYEIQASVGIKLEKSRLHLKDAFFMQTEKEIFYHHEGNRLERYFSKDIVDRLGSSNCLVIAPIRTELSNIYHKGEMGYLIVSKTVNALREEQILLLASLSNALSPLVKQFNEMDKMKETYKVDYRNMFLEDLRKHIEDKISYETDFRIFYKKMEQRLFTEPDLEAYQDIKTYYFD